MIGAPPASSAARLATACAVGLLLSTVGGCAALYAGSEGEGTLGAEATILLIGIPLVLWLGILAFLVAGRRRGALAAGMTTGLGFGVLGSVGAVTNPSSGGGTLSLLGLAVSGVGLYLTLRRPEVAKEFAAADAAALTGTLGRPARVRRRASSLLVALLACLLLAWVVLLVVADRATSDPSALRHLHDPRTAVDTFDASSVSIPTMLSPPEV